MKSIANLMKGGIRFAILESVMLIAGVIGSYTQLIILSIAIMIHLTIRF